MLLRSYCSRADLPQRYSASGELILAQLASAPFPHPSRAEGHRYNGQLFSAKEHYSDSSVAIFIPKGFRETGKIDFVVHFHGWTNHVERVLDHYKLIEQLAASGRNAVLVVPQGPRDAGPIPAAASWKMPTGSNGSWPKWPTRCGISPP